MATIATIHGKPVRVTWSASAEREMRNRRSPVLVEMELYFSCLIRKRVRFHEVGGEASYVSINEHLQVTFRPVMTKSCSTLDETGKPPLDDMPVVNPAAFVPGWLTIDFKRGQWQGEFGYG